MRLPNAIEDNDPPDIKRNNSIPHAIARGLGVLLVLAFLAVTILAVAAGIFSAILLGFPWNALAVTTFVLFVAYYIGKHV